MKKIISLFIITLAVACANKEKKPAGGWDVTITGKVKFPKENGHVSILELTPAEDKKTDSLTVNADGTYEKTMHLTEPGYYRLNFYDLQLVDVVLDKSNIELNVDGNDQAGEGEIKGAPDYDLIRDVQQQLMGFDQQPQIQEMQAKYKEASQKEQEDLLASIKEQYIDLLTIERDKVIKSLESKPVNLGLINLLQGNTFDKDRYYPFYKKVADEAIAKMPNSIHAQQFRDMVQKMGVTAVGQK